MKDLYTILGVSRDASSQTIKLAFRELAKEYHPDLHLGDIEAESRTKEINYAYTVLSDLDRRAAYDAELAIAAARNWKAAYMNAAAIAAGFIALAIVGASATLVTSSRYPAAQQPQQRYALIGVPERTAADYDPADFEGQNETVVAKLPAEVASSGPVQEPEQAALMLVAPLKAASKPGPATALARRYATPSHSTMKRAVRKTGARKIAIVPGGFASSRDLEEDATPAPWFIGR